MAIIPASSQAMPIRRFELESFDVPLPPHQNTYPLNEPAQPVEGLVAGDDLLPPEGGGQAAGLQSTAVPTPGNTMPPPAGSNVPWPTAEALESLHQQAFDEGFAAGKAEGYQAGQAEGFAAGHAEGRVQGHADGVAEGRSEGFAAGRQEALATMQPQATHLNTLVASLDDQLAALNESIGEEVCQLAIELARQLVRHSLEVRPDAICDVVREALMRLPQVHALIHLNPDDAHLAREAIGDQLHNNGHRIVEDPDITRGGCRIDAGGTQVDATLETRWRRVIATLGRESSWHGDELDDSGS